MVHILKRMRKLREVSNWSAYLGSGHWTGLTNTAEGMFKSAADTSENAARNPTYESKMKEKYNRWLTMH